MAVVNITEFSGVSNLNNKAKIGDTELFECINYDVTDKKYLRKRKGCSLLGTSDITFGSKTLPFRYRGRFKSSTGSADYQIVTTANPNTWFYSPSLLGTTVKTTGKSVKHGVQYVDKFWMVDPAQTISTFDGTTHTYLASTPSGTMNLIYKDRMFLINSEGTGGDENKIFYSNFYVTGDTTTEQFKSGSWDSATQFVSAREGDGD